MNDANETELRSTKPGPEEAMAACEPLVITRIIRRHASCIVFQIYPLMNPSDASGAETGTHYLQQIDCSNTSCRNSLSVNLSLY